MTRLLLSIGIFTLIACKPTVTHKGEAIKAEATISENDNFNLVRKQIGQMVDPSFSESSDFDSLFKSYLVSANGEVQQVSDSAAIALYQRLILSGIDQLLQGPVFEVCNTNNVVLLLKDDKVWANMLIDKQSMVILRIQFPPGSETEELKEKTKNFQEQFIGSTISFTEDNFVLTAWEDKTILGKVQIDGISGATKICQASVDMLNNQLPFYSDYLQSKETNNTK
jgi:hypothetical protein